MSPILGILASSNYQRATSSYYSIATTTVGSGGASSVSFTSIPSTYTHLQIRWIGATNRASYNDDLVLRINGVTTSSYNDHRMYGNGSTVTSGRDTGTTMYVAAQGLGSTGAGANTFGVGVMDILDYTDTNKYKTLRTLAGLNYNTADTSGSYGQITLQSGFLTSTTNAITQIDFLSATSSSFLQYTQFALYGIKGA